MRGTFLIAMTLLLPLPAAALPPQGAGGAAACVAGHLLAGVAPTGKGDFADPGIHVAFYRLDLTLLPSIPRLRGAVAATVVCLAESLTTVSFDLSGRMTVDSVTARGVPLRVTQFLQGFEAQLAATLHRGDTLTLETYYGGLPLPTGYGSFQFSSAGSVPWIWTLSEPYGARDWWPCKDDNSDKADSVDMSVTLPAGLRAGSNGTLRGVRTNGDGTVTYLWSERYPIAAYLVSLAATGYDEVDDWFRYSPADSMPIVNYVLPSAMNGGTGALAETPAMLRIFSDAYGLYPFTREKYGHAQFGWGGAMEHQTMTSTSNFAENTISHELAHQWFGDMITCANWPNLWLNEGFAVYSECVFLERYYGESEYRAHIGDYMTPAMNAKGTLYVQDTSTVAGLFDYNRVYSKGAWTLHMLRHVLGDSVFFRALRAYASDPRFRYRSATTEGFRSVCESVSGRDLGYFFNEWVYGEGFPRYTFRWDAAPSRGGYSVSLSLSQAGSSPATPLFTMPVDVEITGSGEDTTLRVLASAQNATFTLQVPFAPSDVKIDPLNWILRDVIPASELLPEAYALGQNYPNPFNPGTTITFSLPHREVVTLRVFDILGRRVAELIDGRVEAGTQTVRWEGTDASGRTVAGGTYFYRLTAGEYTQTRRMVLIR